MAEILIRVERLSYAYGGRSGKPALDGLCFDVRSGERLAILGANGSGKSTLLKCLNGLLSPPPLESGSASVTVYDSDGSALHPANSTDLERVRRRLATVLQDPDDQIISSVVEEDTAFGPENLGLSGAEVRGRVDAALTRCRLEAFRKKEIRYLSGGEKQRLALAGVLALGTDIIALDEAVSMLDPGGRNDFLSLLDELTAAGKTIIQITHSLREAARCERCLVLHGGSLVFDGPPGLLIERPELEEWGFAIPEAVKLSRLFRAVYPGFPLSAQDAAGAAERIIETVKKNAFPQGDGPPGERARGIFPGGVFPGGEIPGGIVSFENASHVYGHGKESSGGGMREVSFEIAKPLTENAPGELVALIGKSGSGKSTILKHINALLVPAEGRVRVLGNDTLDPKVKLSSLRMRAALSVQSPESALFERYVADDVAFGPKNGGLSGPALLERVKAAMESAGLSFGEFADRETRSLSGGEKRRAAVAGTAAIESEILLLDEPFAALDGFHQKKILELINGFREAGKTVIISTHSMETAVLADRVGVVVDGRVAAFAPPGEIFGSLWSRDWGLSLPWIVSLARCLVPAGLVPENAVPLNAEELFACLRVSARENARGGGKAAAAEAGAEPGDSARGEKAKDPPVPENGRAADKDRKRRRRKTGIEIFQRLSFFRFLDRPSFLRNCGGGVKLALLLGLFAAVLAGPPPFFPLVLLVFILAAGWFAGRVGPLHLLRGFFSLLPWLCILSAIQMFFRFDPLRTLSLVFRIASLSALISLFAAVTPLSDLLRSMNRLLSFFARFGLPARDITLGMGIALRFVPVLSEEAERIVSAQLSRGGKKGRVRMAFSLLVPLFIRALERAETLVTAMLLRCYRR